MTEPEGSGIDRPGRPVTPHMLRLPHTPSGKRRRFWRPLAVASLLLLGAAALAAALLPAGTLPGFLAGEPFYGGRPARYWREALRRYGREGRPPDEVLSQSWDTPDALPVLEACARDPDPNVRWPAIGLVGRAGRGERRALSLLSEALRDESRGVRVQAAGAFAEWGPLARDAVPALAECLGDADVRTAHAADLALWRVDLTAAAKACGWRAFRAPDPGFAVMLPAEPERSEHVDPRGPVRMLFWRARHRVGRHPAPTWYTVAVGDYPEEIELAGTEAARLGRARKLARSSFAGRLASERGVEQGGIRGYEQVFELEGGWVMRARFFCPGRRLYRVEVRGLHRFLNDRAAGYFLDSFRLDNPAEGPRGASGGRPAR